MSITFDLQPYCNKGCVDFEPRHETIASSYYDVKEMRHITVGTTLVRCQHESKCQSIYLYLKDQLESENKNG